MTQYIEKSEKVRKLYVYSTHLIAKTIKIIRKRSLYKFRAYTNILLLTFTQNICSIFIKKHSDLLQTSIRAADLAMVLFTPRRN